MSAEMHAAVAAVLSVIDGSSIVESDNLGCHAVELACRGWAVLPCKWAGPLGKAPLTEHGHLDATTDLDTIRGWWTRWPQALIGARVDPRLVVLDIDPRNGGTVAALGDLPLTLTCWSGRGDGGRHLFLLRPAGPLTSTRLPPGVDLKVAGYTVVPPSLHPETGRPYRWEEHPVAPLPPHLRTLLQPVHRPVRQLGPRRRGDGRHLVEFVAAQPEGNRNRGLHWAACRAADDDLLDDLLDDLADDLVAAAVSAGHPEAGARRTVQSAARRAGVS